MSNLDKLANIIKNEIKKLAEDFRKQNGNSSLRISNKDMNLWMIMQILELRKDIDVMKLKTRLLQWFFGIAIALIAVVQII